MPASTPVPDDDQITVKTCKTGFRVQRGSGADRPFLWVRPGELINLTNILIDEFEKSKKP
jgi:hypothetical protein